MDLPRFVKRFKGVRIFTLVSDIPLGLKVLDLGGGIAPEAQGSPAPAGAHPVRAHEGPLGGPLRARRLEHRARARGFSGHDVQPHQDLGRNPRRHHRHRASTWP